MKSFDDILKKGKGRVAGTSSSEKKWKQLINSIMENTHALNGMYPNDLHNLKIENVECKKCKVSSYVLSVRDINNSKKVTRFHKNKWKPVGKGGYYCDKCK